MTIELVSLATIVVLAVLLWRHRVRYLRDRPFVHDRREYAGAGALAEALASSTKLTVHQDPPGWSWLADFALSPVLLLWGDLRLSRAETQLARWRLEGKRGDRDATIVLDPDRVTLRLAARAPTLWVTSSGPLEQQEHVRALHPVGGDAWRAASVKLDALFALGVEEVRGGAGRLDAVVPREKLTLEHVGDQLDALAALASTLEATS